MRFQKILDCVNGTRFIEAQSTPPSLVNNAPLKVLKAPFMQYHLKFSPFSSWFDLFDKYGGPDEGKLKLKAPKQLQEVLDITRDLLQEAQKGGEIHENPAKLMQMKSVLEM